MVTDEEIDEEIEVECNKITKDGTLLCNITTQNLAKMNRLGIKPDNNQFNVIDKVLDSSQSTEENKSIDETKPTDGAKSSDEAKPTKADSSNKQGCGCSTTENEIANFLAKFQIKKEEN